MTSWAEIPLTDTARAAVARAFRIEADGEAERLHGGEESASYRIGDNVIRIGPEWRGTSELEWCYVLASRAAEAVAEVKPPRTNADRRHVIRVDGRPVSVWPFVEGQWADKHDAAQRARAPELLARLHRALRSVVVRPRPGSSDPLAPVPDLNDPALDAWITAAYDRYAQHQPLHGDFYRGNILTREGTFVALLDWDNALIGPPEQELAWASWEWSDARRTLDLSSCVEFVSAYTEADGSARSIDEGSIAQFVRARLRWEVAYSRAIRERGAGHGPDDLAYEAASIDAFRKLRPPEFVTG